MRLAKYLSTHNLCSRREAERRIAKGEVQVNGVVITTPVCFVDDSDSILFKGLSIQSQPDPAVLWLYYKPTGEITTHRDPAGRPTVFQSVQKQGLARVISIGRLDINSEGLLLLTNNSALAHQLEKPNEALTRVYEVRVFGIIDQKAFMRWSPSIQLQSREATLQNVVLEGVRYAPLWLSFEQPIERFFTAANQRPRNFWCTLRITEGKNREIRKVMNALGVQVNRLIRTEYGPFQLNDMKPGGIKEIEIPQNFGSF